MAAGSQFDAHRPKDRSLLIKYWLPVIFWMGFIFYASSVPAKDIPPLFPLQDMAFHLAAYASLAYFFARATKNTYLNLSPRKILYLSLIFGALYGLSDEFHQAFVPGRDVSGLDLIVDSSASYLGALFITR